MFDILKRFALIGLGALSFSEDKIKELINELVKKGDISKEEGDDLFKKFVKRAEEEKCSLDDWMKKRLGEILKRMDIVTRDDLNKLEKKVKTLKKEIEILKKAGGKD